jgi:hypothetical protein
MLIPKSASREEDDLLILAKIRSSCSIVLCNGRRRRRRCRPRARARARTHAGRRPWPRPDFGENELDFVTIDD